MTNNMNLENINLLHSFFLRSSKLYPNNYALSIGKEKWTYSEIEHTARCWANTLLKNTSGRMLRVGVFGNKSYEVYVGVLASLFSGATYVPLNQKFPKERTLSMIKQADLDAIIVDNQSFGKLKELVGSLEKQLVVLCPGRNVDEEFDSNINIFDKSNLENSKPLETLPEVNEDNFAYILFTSGSTGKPKGVPISHKNVASFLKYNINRYKFTPEDKFTQTFDLTFDLSVFDLFMSWGGGGCLCVMQPIQLLSPFRFIEEQGVTVWFSVPSIVSLYRKKNSLKKGCLPSLKWSLFCGEALAKSSVEAWQEMAPQSKIENLYGPTELTIACASYSWDKENSEKECVNGIVPIGKVFNILDSIIIDENNKIVDVGEQGELCVLGPQMFNGYLNNKEKTMERFVEVNSKKYYRTGDIVKVNNNNNYIYLGRKDYQTKVQGFRIELGEIESVIRFNENVIEASAIPWPIVDDEAQGIVAFVSGNNINEDELLELCKKHLPYYMQPKHIYILKDVPYNVNGKIDYNALKKKLSEEF